MKNRRRKGLPLHGWLILDKPLGMTSTQGVGAIRRLTGAAKIGHGGTLDPLATGLLPIALGEATKTVSYVMDATKTYTCRVRWGEARTTDDGEGEVCATSEVRPTEAAILAVLPRFLGEIEQLPPIFSALKIDGRRAYDMARAGEVVDLASRRVRIEDLTLVGCPDSDHADFEVVCGKGTYIRALARDLAVALGTVGHVVQLRRTRCGRFDLTNAILLDLGGEQEHNFNLRAYLLPIETALDDIPAVALSEAEARRFQGGQFLPLSRLERPFPFAGPDFPSTLRAMDGSRVVALAQVQGDELRPLRVFNLTPPNEGDHDVDYA